VKKNIWKWFTTRFINKLIAEAKNVKFLKAVIFLEILNKSQVDSYYSLSGEEQDDVKPHVKKVVILQQKTF
jgi:hypothetical protein